MAGGADVVDRIQGALRAGQEGQEVRRFLASAYGALADIQQTAVAGAYTLDLALQDHLNELDGTPSTGRLSRVQRLDRLLEEATTRVTQAMLLEEEELGDEMVAGQGFVALSSLVPGVGGLTLPAELPASLPQMPTVGVPSGSVLAGGALGKAKDVLT